MRLTDCDTSATPYGPVDTSALHILRDSYDTAGMLQMVDQLDEIRVRLDGIDGVRDDLLRLHAMTHTVINNSRLVVPSDATNIWEAAEELLLEFKDLARIFERLAQQLEPLINLEPK